MAEVEKREDLANLAKPATHRHNRITNGKAMAPTIKYIRRSNRIQKIPEKNEKD